MSVTEGDHHASLINTRQYRAPEDYYIILWYSIYYYNVVCNISV